jgi:hypothetical protein
MRLTCTRFAHVFAGKRSEVAMTDNHTRGEIHGCIVCGRLYELYVVHNSAGRFVGMKVMSAGAKEVPDARRPLVACERHSEAEISKALQRVYGKHDPDEE